MGNLTVSRAGGPGTSSTVSGYTAGGINDTCRDIIDKYPFASDANATDVGDLTVGRYGVAGQQA